MANWQEIQITADINLAESLSDFLINLTGRGISLEDIPRSLKGTALQTQRIKAYLPSNSHYEAEMSSLFNFIKKLEEIFPDSSPVCVTSETIAEQDWAQTWKTFFKPMRLTKRIVIKPSWEDFTGKGEDVVLEIDPGLAFGTGSHPTTYLCLQALEDMILNRQFRSKFPRVKVLDVGTGTGILGMAAARLGAHPVKAIDVDREAVQVATENVKKNTLEDKLEVSNQALAEVTGKFPLILANILYQELIDICPLLFERVEQDGILILSGILSEQVDSLLDIYRKQGFKTLSISQREGWACPVLTRRNRSL